MLNDQQQAANAAADAAKLLFGLYSEKASKPMEELQGFLQERLALGGAASDVRMVQDERFNETCSTPETLSNELYYAGRLGRPGAKPPVRVEQEALQQELEKTSPGGVVATAVVDLQFNGLGRRFDHNRNLASQVPDLHDGLAGVV